MSAKITLIIPTYSRFSSLKRVLPYYLKQKFIKEILIVNDSGGNDPEGYFKNLASDGCERLRYVGTARHMGLPAARNIGIKEATGDFILFGEDDLYFADDYAERLLECIYRTGADIIAGRIISLRHGQTKDQSVAKADGYQGPLVDKELIFGRLWKDTQDDVETPFIHACALIKKKVFEKILYDEGFLGNGWREETDMYLRALGRGFKIYFCPHALCYHLPRDFSLSGGCLNMNVIIYQYWALKNNYRFLKRHYPFLRGALGLTRGILPLMLIQARARLRQCLIHFVEKYFLAKKVQWEDFLT